MALEWICCCCGEMIFLFLKPLDSILKNVQTVLIKEVSAEVHSYIHDSFCQLFSLTQYNRKMADIGGMPERLYGLW